MTDDKMNQRPNTAPAVTDDDPVQQPLRKMSDDELQTILAEHVKWLDSDGSDGAQADLSQVDLRGEDLKGADLRKAILYVTDLREAELHKADLQEAILAFTDFRGATLWKADMRKARFVGSKLSEADFGSADLSECALYDVKGLHEANLQDCNFEGATGLKGTEFARADITGAKLPEDIREFKSLEVVEEISKNARKIFFAMLLGCAYALLTIATTTDARLLTNSASSPLPIIRTEIPIANFYLAAPFILIGLFVYLHLYLQRLWGALAKLPARFEDGKSLDERAYPWLLNGLVRRHFEKLKEGRSLMAHLEEYASIFLAWWVLPLTLGAFWYRYLWRHDWTGTSLHIGLIVLTVVGAILFYRSHARTLRGNLASTIVRKRYLFKPILQVVSLLALGLGLSIGSYGAIEGLFFEMEPDRWYGETPSWARANLRESQLSTIPPNYWSLDKNIRDSAVIGANLRGADLRYAHLQGSNLVNADLKYANLEGCNLWLSNLSNANLDSANLTGVDLTDAELVSATLRFAILNDAELDYANLTGATLLGGALIRAVLKAAILTNADMRYTNLTSARLNDATLMGADLRHSILAGAEFDGANLRDTRLAVTNLRETTGLTQKQLDQACGDTLTTKLPTRLTIRQCPY